MELPEVPLRVRKGDSYSFFWQILQEDGSYFIPSGEEKVIIGIKNNKRATTYILKKIYTSENFDENGFYFELSCDETANFLPGTYVYDIGVKLVDESETSKFYHVIKISNFIVEESITLPE